MKASNSSMNAEKTRVSGVQLAAYQASSFERFTQMKGEM